MRKAGEPRGAGRPPEPRAYGVALAAVTAALGVALLLHPIAGLENVDLVFLTAVIAVAARYGLGPSLVASVASVLAYNFFFIPPLHTFEVADPKNLAALGFFLVFAVVTSHLAARVRSEALAARLRAETTEALYDFSRRIASVPDCNALLGAAAERMASLLGRDVVLLLPNAAGSLEVRARSNPDDWIEDLDLDTARAAWRAGEWANRDVMRVGWRLILPMRTGQGAIGIVGLSRGVEREDLSSEDERMVAALSDQVAVSVERFRLAAERDEARLSAEAEKLRSALLNALSHDLKTPLASILGAATALRQDTNRYDAAVRDELAGTIEDEAERMTRFVANLLDMTRLEAGAVTLDRGPVDVGEVVGTALHRTHATLAGHQVDIDLDAALPMLDLDVVLFEQALVNLLDNAAKYAPPGSAVMIAGRRVDGGVEITVADEGPGLWPEDVERVFDKFYRASRGGRQRAGTGLGLAISRGFVEALGGAIKADNRADRRGAVFTIRFPPEIVSSPAESAAE